MTQQELLDAATATIAGMVPEAYSVQLNTSDQNTGYGFWVAAVWDHGLSPLLDAPDGLSRINDAVYEYLCDLDWDGVVGENKYGTAMIWIDHD